VAITGALALVACLRPAEERAQRDLEVGRALVGGIEFRVVDGLAQVRASAPGKLGLWAGAPLFTLAGQAQPEATRDLSLTVDNLLPNSRLVKDGVELVGEQVIGDPPTRFTWSMKVEPGAFRWQVLPPDASLREPWSFAVLNDVQDAVDRIEQLLVRINQESEVRFVVSAGDLTEQGTAQQMAAYQGKLAALDRPYYTTLGNHDVGADNERPSFTDWFGRASFHFEYRGTAFTFLDSASATLDPTVDGWLDDWLALSRDETHVVITHFPWVDPVGVRNGSFASRQEAYGILARLAAGRIALSLHGHLHSYYSLEQAGILVNISGGGGAIPERFDRIGRHFLVVRVDPGAGRVTESRVVSVP
jgi:hypothetical protein